MTSKRIGFGLVALSAVFALACIITEVQGEDPSNVVTKPFKIDGGGDSVTGLVFPPAFSCHDATGTATHLGTYTTKDGKFSIDSFDPANLIGEFHGAVVFVAANGDELKFTYQASANPELDGTGKFYGVPQEDGTLIATFIQEFTPVPEDSTGRFAKVTGGSFIMTATSEPVPAPYFGVPFAYTWEGEGTLEFAGDNE